MHFECLATPIELVKAGGQYFAFDKGEIAVVHGSSVHELLYYVCPLCFDARDIDSFMSIYDPVSKSIGCDEEELSEEQVERSFYLIKPKKASYLHSVWVPYKFAVLQKKFRPFIKKIQDSDILCE